MSESRPEDCSHCSKQNHLHLTKVIDGKLIKMSVCSDCPHAEHYKTGVGFDLIPGGGSSSKAAVSSGSGVSCPNCGLRPEDFKEFGRLGCSACYEVFAEKLEPLYRKLHNDRTEHLGKSPKGQKRVVSPEEIKALKLRMKEHVIREEYELAAVVRDQLRSLES